MTTIPPSTKSVMAQRSSENFVVASRLLPRQIRGHLLALYGFARLVDDVGDEVDGDRSALLDRLEGDVERIYRGVEPRHPVMQALAPTVSACDLPGQPLLALIEANRRDQWQSTYRTFEDLLDYCALSANPIGHLVLCVFGAATPARRALADAVCTGLQLTEHCQDIAEDLARGRVYLPLEDLDRFGCSRADLAEPRASVGVRALIAFEVARARELLNRGLPLIGTLRGRHAFAVAGFIAGGRTALDAIERAGYDVLGHPPRARRRARLAAALADAWRWRSL